MKGRDVILDEMAEVRRVVSLGLQARARSGVRIRQPLGHCVVHGPAFLNDYRDLIADALNVKRVRVEGPES